MLEDVLYVWRLLASYCLTSACLLLGRLAGLPSDGRARLARFAFQHVSVRGSQALESMTQPAPALDRLGCGTDPTCLLLLTQLETVGHALRQAPRDQSADQLLPAEALAAWLGACTESALTLPRQAELFELAVGALAANLSTLCFDSFWRPLTSALAAEEELTSGLVQLLESFMAGAAAALRLPEERRPASCSWLSAAHAVLALTSKPLQPALQSRLAQEPARAPALLVAAAQLLEQLPPDAAELGISQAAYPALSLGLATYIGQLARLARDTGAALQQPPEQQQRLAQQLLPCIAGLPRWLRLLAGPQPNSRSLQHAAAVCEAFQSVTLLLLGLSNGDGSQHGGSSQQAAHLAAAWCTSAAAALASAPWLVQVRQGLQRTAADEHTQRRFAIALDYLLSFQEAAATLTLHASSAGSLDSPAALQPAVWRLHTACCRLVAWCDANRVNGELALPASSLQQPIEVLAVTVMAAMQLQSVQAGTQDASAGHLEALLLAHWSALRTLQPAIVDGAAGHPPSLLMALTTSLAACIGRAPTQLGLDAELRQLFDQVLDSVPESVKAKTFKRVATAASSGPPLMVHLLLTGRLDSMLNQLLQRVSTRAINAELVRAGEQCRTPVLSKPGPNAIVKVHLVALSVKLFIIFPPEHSLCVYYC
jgi:hypothetical protein